MKANREKAGGSDVLGRYAYWVAGLWTLASFFAIFVCYIIASIAWDARLSFWPALTISSAIMTAVWIVLVIKARRRDYVDVFDFRLEVAFALSLMLFMSLQPLFDLSQATRYLLVIPFTGIWVVVHFSVRRAGKNRRRKE